MMSEAFSSYLGGATGISPYKTKVERKLRDLSVYFQDGESVREMLARGENPRIYQVYEIPQLEVDGLLNVGCTVIYPGKIGREYYFTKGHFHRKESTCEIYIGMEGEGLILIQQRSGKVASMEIKPDVLVFIPPGTAHRSINTGTDKLLFLAIYPSDSGHDYETIERTGFAKIVVEREGKPIHEDNPKYRVV